MSEAYERRHCDVPPFLADQKCLFKASVGVGLRLNASFLGDSGPDEQIVAGCVVSAPIGNPLNLFVFSYLLPFNRPIGGIWYCLLTC